MIMSKKIKIFLGGFINLTNAQNLNCLAIAKHLDKEKFEVYTLELFSGNLESQIGRIPGVQIFNCFKPFRISGYLGFLWGIWNCDVAYLPKHEFWKFNRLLLRLFKKKSFSTVEGILDEDNLLSAIQVLKSYDDVIESKKYFSKLFSITKFLGNYNEINHQIVSGSIPLYLGCDTDTFYNSNREKESLKTIAYVGRLKKRKGIFDFLEIAKKFPHLNFLIFGNGEDQKEVEDFITLDNLKNTKLRGTVSHQELAIELINTQLHILPSRSEGFPKVILETAAAGVPSVVYSDYGASEWITSGENGWVVDTKEEIINLISTLEKEGKTLQSVSENALQLAKDFDWSKKIKDWEVVIESLIK